VKKLMFFVFFLSFLFYTNAAVATELVYQPINPSFGGNPLNGNFLLNKAQAQNKFGNSSSFSRRDPLENFEETLTRRILSMLASQIVEEAFGGYGEELQGGHYEFGDYLIDIIPTEGEDIRVTITDMVTGSTTTVAVPYYY